MPPFAYNPQNALSQYHKFPLKMTGNNKNKKTPACKWKEPINYSFGEDTSINYGIPCGKINNITVIDLDFHKLTNEQLENNSFYKEFGNIAEFCDCIVETGSGGFHLYYLYDKDIPQSTSEKHSIDVRNDGGYVVAPNSSLDKDTNYRYLKDKPPSTMPLMMKEWFQNNYYHKKVSLPPTAPNKNVNDRWEQLTAIIHKVRLRSHNEYFKFLAAGFNLRIDYTRIDNYLNDPICAGKYNKEKNLLHWEALKKGEHKAHKKAGWKTLELMAALDDPEKFTLYKQNLKIDGLLKEKNCDEAVVILEKTFPDMVLLGRHQIYALTPKKELVGHISQKERFEGILGMLIKRMNFKVINERTGNYVKCWTSYEARRNLVKTWIETILNDREPSDIEDQTYQNERKFMQFSNGCWNFENKEWLEGVFENHFGECGDTFNPEVGHEMCVVNHRLLDPILGDLKDYFLNWVVRGLSKRIEDKTFGFAVGLRDSGKSVLCNALTKAFPHVQRFNSDCLLSKGNEGFMPKDLGFMLTISNCGVALGSEPSKGKFKKLDGEVLKSIVGGEPLVGRELYGKPVKFCFRGRLLMCANTPPEISTKDSGEKLIQFPFENKFASKEIMEASPHINYMLADNTIHEYINSQECIDALRLIVLNSFGNPPPIPECMIEEISMMTEDAGESETTMLMKQIRPCAGGKLWTSEILERLDDEDFSGRTVNAIMKLHGYKFKKIMKQGVRKYGFVGCELIPEDEEESKCLI